MDSGGAWHFFLRNGCGWERSGGIMASYFPLAPVLLYPVATSIVRSRWLFTVIHLGNCQISVKRTARHRPAPILYGVLPANRRNLWSALGSDPAITAILPTEDDPDRLERLYYTNGEPFWVEPTRLLSGIAEDEAE